MAVTKLVYKKKIRAVWDERSETEYYCLNDVIHALTNVKDAKNYLKQNRQRDKKFADNWGELVIPIEMDTAGGKQKLMCTDVDGLYLLLQRMRSSEKKEAFKQWLMRRKIYSIENARTRLNKIK